MQWHQFKYKLPKVNRSIVEVYRDGSGAEIYHVGGDSAGLEGWLINAETGESEEYLYEREGSSNYWAYLPEGLEPFFMKETEK